MKWRWTLLCVLAAGFCGCEQKGKNLLLGQPIEPSITGTWTGDVIVNGALAHAQFQLVQDNIHVTGTYTATSDNDLSQTLGNSGTITGATTGPTFSLTLKPEETACTLTVQLGGQNYGPNVSFSLTGTDCGNTVMRGQATLKKS